MSQVALIRRATRHFCSPHLTRAQNKSLRRKWLASVQMLGQRWLLHPANVIRAAR